MSDRNPHSRPRSGGPPARTPWPVSRSLGALSASRSFSGSPAARDRAADDTAPARAQDEAAPGPGWREPFLMLVLAVASFGTVLLLFGGVAVPVDSMTF